MSHYDNITQFLGDYFNNLHNNHINIDYNTNASNKVLNQAYSTHITDLNKKTTNNFCDSIFNQVIKIENTNYITNIINNEAYSEHVSDVNKITSTNFCDALFKQAINLENSKKNIADEILLQNKVKSFCSDLFRIHILYDKKILELKQGLKKEKVKYSENISKDTKEKLSLKKEQNFEIKSKIKSVFKFDNIKLKIEKNAEFESIGIKKPQIRFSSLQKYDKLAKLTQLNSNKSFKNNCTNYVNNDQSYHLTPLKISTREKIMLNANPNKNLSKENDTSFIASLNEHNFSQNEKGKLGLDEQFNTINYTHQKLKNLPNLNLDKTQAQVPPLQQQKQRYVRLFSSKSPIGIKRDSYAIGNSNIKSPDVDEWDKIYRTMKKDLTGSKPAKNFYNYYKSDLTRIESDIKISQHKRNNSISINSLNKNNFSFNMNFNNTGKSSTPIKMDKKLENNFSNKIWN